jgi:PAS domain S-box-containing protein
MDRTRPKLQLSDREEQLIKLASSGHTDASIAHELGISEATVGTYWGRIRIKLGPYSRTELVSIVLRAEQEVALTDLREANAELAKKLEVSSGAEDAFYKSLIDNAADAILLTSEAGIITSANQKAHELFGYNAGELSGLHVTTLVPPRFREDHVQHLRSYTSSPARRTMGEHLSTPALKRDGTEFAIRAALSAVNTPAGLVVMCAVRLASSDSSS